MRTKGLPSVPNNFIVFDLQRLVFRFYPLVALLGQVLELFFLFGDAARHQVFIGRAGSRRRFFDQLAQIVANDRDTVFELGKLSGKSAMARISSA